MSHVGWALSQFPSGPHVRTDVPRRLNPRSQVKRVESMYSVPPDWSTVPLITAGSIPQSEEKKNKTPNADKIIYISKSN